MAEIIVVHGTPGSGKSTQCESLVSEGINWGLVTHVSAGNRLRDIRAGRAQSEFESIINDPKTSSPLDDRLVNDTIFEVVPATADTQQPALTLIDGYPRHPSAVEVFLNRVHADKHRFLGTIALRVPLEVSLERIITRGTRAGESTRSETLLEFAKSRYEQDTHTTQHAINELSRFATVTRIDATRDTKSVEMDFRSAIDSLAGQL